MTLLMQKTTVFFYCSTIVPKEIEVVTAEVHGVEIEEMTSVAVMIDMAGIVMVVIEMIAMVLAETTDMVVIEMTDMAVIEMIGMEVTGMETEMTDMAVIEMIGTEGIDMAEIGTVVTEETAVDLLGVWNGQRTDTEVVVAQLRRNPDKGLL